MAGPIIFLHTLDGKPLSVRLGHDTIYVTDLVIVKKDGVKYTVRETKKEVGEIIKDGV